MNILKKLFQKHNTRREQPETTASEKNESGDFVIILSPGERGFLLEMLRYNPPNVGHLPALIRREIWGNYESVYMKLCNSNNAVSATKII